ncbi:MAG: DUF1634 domain-containing protein [Ignavibacteriales bacterium]|nr:DUF1634 domain-containing protein [Ignavibacteriales bacterium]
MSTTTMTPSEKLALEHTVERWVGWVLRIGVWASAGLMMTGLLVAWLASGSLQVPRENPTPGEILRNLAAGSFDPTTLIFAGLLLLMLTPFIRVLTAAIGFAAEKDKPFVAVALVVLAMLLGELVFSLR